MNFWCQTFLYTKILFIPHKKITQTSEMKYRIFLNLFWVKISKLSNIVTLEVLMSSLIKNYYKQGVSILFKVPSRVEPPGATPGHVKKTKQNTVENVPLDTILLVA